MRGVAPASLVRSSLGIRYARAARFGPPETLAWDGAFSWSATLLALIALVALHIAVNALNEASDMKTGIDLHTTRTPFSGGSGTIQAGAIDVNLNVRVLALPHPTDCR